jgi:peptide/nickel transport system permease protein
VTAVLLTARRWLADDPRRSFALGALLLLLAIAFFGPLITFHDPVKVNVRSRFLPPDTVYWFGTDRYGFDIFSRGIHAARTNVLIALGSVAISIGLGVPIGVIVGYVGGKLDSLSMRVIDVFQAFPTLVLAIAVLAVLGSGAFNITLVIGLIGVPTYVRLVRGEVRVIRELPYVEAARSVGCSPPRLIMRYIVPGTLGTVMVQAATSCGWAMILTAGLGFLGLGPKVPNPEWGYMISTGSEDMVAGHWWTSFFPGMMIVAAVLVFNLLGEVLADAVDPRRSAQR